jgi:hypothetical protein
MMVHSFNPSTQEAEAGRPRVQGQSGLLSKFEASLSVRARPCILKEKFIYKLE